VSIKVLHVYRTYFPDSPGGVQEVIRQIALATKTFGIESRIFALSPNPCSAPISLDEGQVTQSKSLLAPASCDIGGINSLRAFKELVDWADVLHYQFPWPFADALHFLAHVKKPSLLTYQSDIVRQRFLGRLYAPLMHRMLASMSSVIATSPAYAMTSPVLKKYVSPSRLKVVPNGIADFRDKVVTKPISPAIQTLISQNRSFILSIGVMRYYKGFHSLVAAALTIDAPIVFAGSGPEELDLRRQAADIGANNVIFLGQISDDEKILLLRHCSIFVLPSHLRSEAFGMVLVEAAMFGKPLVCCEIGSGTSYINIDKETGFVVSPENPLELSEAINILLKDKSLAADMGLAARFRYEKYFSGEALGEAYSLLYREAVNQVPVFS